MGQFEFSQKSDLAQGLGSVVIAPVGGDVDGTGNMQGSGVVENVEEVVAELDGKLGGRGVNR